MGLCWYLSTCACQGLGEGCAWGFNLRDRTPLLETKDHGLEQEPSRVTALPPPELPTPSYCSDLHGDAWFVVGNVGKGLPCNHTAVTC